MHALGLRPKLVAGMQRVVGLDFFALALGRRWHYAWVVLTGAMVVVALSAGVRFSFAVFVSPLAEGFGWSMGAISFAYFLGYISAVPFSLAAGWLADSVGVRPVMAVSVALFTLGMILTATMTELWQFYLFFGVLAGGVSIVSAGLLSAAVTRWFHRRLGMAVGLVFTSTGSGPLLLAPLFSWGIASAGWTKTFLLIGILGGGLMMVAALLLRSHPREMGTTPYGEVPGAPAAKPAPSVTLRMVQGDRSFWFLITIHLLGCVGHSVLLAHVVRLALLQGVPGMLAAGLISAMSGTSVVSRFFTPILTERWGGRATLALGFLLQSLGAWMFLGAESPFAFYLVTILFGLGYGAEMSGFPIINRQYYGASAPLNSIHAWEWSGGLIGMGLGGWLGGVLFDWSGSYTWSIWLASLAGLAAMPFILSLPGRAQQPPIISIQKAKESRAPQ